MTREVKNPDLTKVTRQVRQDLDRVEETLARVLGAAEGLTAEVSAHVLASPGKRLRPILVLLVSRLGEQDGDRAVAAAAAVELVHTATLVHDDSIDHSSLRRGRETINARWGESISLIFGDYLYSRSFMLLAEAGLYDAMQSLATATHLMTCGELLQWERRGQTGMTEDDYLRIVKYKTASLFAASCRVGAAASKNGNGHVADVMRFGENLGIAYQMVDDLLDFIGAERSLGKPVGNDLREGRTTLPLIRALDQAGEAGRAEFQALLRGGGAEDGRWSDVVGFVSRHGGIRYCRQRVEEFIHTAKQSLAAVEPSEARDALLAIADSIVGKSA
jgi:octaprenyl-diphosphate synthase